MHCVFSTKGRVPSIHDPAELGRYLGGIARNKNIPLIIAGGTNNHVHLLLALPAAMPLAKAMQDFKGNSSRWMGEHESKFAWQEGYGGFSVSQSYRDAVVDYISRQEEHHAKHSFEQEFEALVRKCGIEFDPRYFLG